MKKILIGIAVCILAVSLGGCLDEDTYDSVQTTGSVESNFVESTTTAAEEATTTNEITTTAKTTTTVSTTKRSSTTKSETTTKVTTMESTATQSTTTKTTTTTTTKLTTTSTAEPAQITYVLNIDSQKFHFQSCHHAAKIKAENRQQFTGSRQQVVSMGYTPCGTCKP